MITSAAMKSVRSAQSSNRLQAATAIGPLHRLPGRLRDHPAEQDRAHGRAERSGGGEARADRGPAARSER